MASLTPFWMGGRSVSVSRTFTKRSGAEGVRHLGVAVTSTLILLSGCEGVPTSLRPMLKFTL